MARPRKPTRLKILAGTDRPHRHFDEPEYVLTSNATPPHRLIGPMAKDEWGRLVPLLESEAILTEADLSMLVVLCNLFGQVMRIWDAGSSPQSAQLTQLRLLYQEFGLTPASRTRVARLPVTSEKRDRREELMKPTRKSTH